MPGTATYLYCIVHAAKRPAVARTPAGVPGGGRLTAHPAGKSLWVIVADVPLDTYGTKALEPALRDMNWVADVAMAHESVVEHFSRRRAATVLPMKLFTMFSSVDRAIEETSSRSREIAAVVKRIAGCEEWGVRLTRVPTPVSGKTRSAPRPDSGAAFLAAKKQTRDAERERLQTAAKTAETVYEALSAIARDARARGDVPAGAAAPPLLDAAFLVPGGHRARFKSAARRLAAASAAAGTELTITGPWPAYNFVQSGSPS